MLPVAKSDVMLIDVAGGGGTDGRRSDPPATVTLLATGVGVVPVRRNMTSTAPSNTQTPALTPRIFQPRLELLERGDCARRCCFRVSAAADFSSRFHAF